MVCVLRRSSKGSMYLVNARLVVRNAARLDLRNAANSLQIEGKGVLPADPYHWGVGTRNTRYIHSIIKTYIADYIIMCIIFIFDNMYIYIFDDIYIYIHISTLCFI